MPRHDDRYGSNTRLYVGHLSSRTHSRDLEHIFSKYGRVRDVDMKRDYAFVEFSDPRDADDAIYHMDGRDVDGRRITVEFARGVPRGPGRAQEFVGRRGPTPGVGCCFNCGIDGHWARDCTAGDWKNKCYRCGDRGHIERNCQNSPKKLRRDRSYSRSPVRSCSPRHGRSRSFSKSRSYSRSSSPARRGRDVDHDERKSRSPARGSPDPKRGAAPLKSGKRSSTPVRDDPRERGSPPNGGRIEMEQDGHNDSPKGTSALPSGGRRMELEQNGYNDLPKETTRSPASPAAMRYETVNGHNHSPSPNILKDDRIPVDDDNECSPRGRETR